MNDVRKDELIRLGMQRELTPEEESRLEGWLAAHPEDRAAWDDERALNRALRRACLQQLHFARFAGGGFRRSAGRPASAGQIPVPTSVASLALGRGGGAARVSWFVRAADGEAGAIRQATTDRFG